MSNIIITIETDNDGLRDGASVADVIREAARIVEAGEVDPVLGASLRDVNGNTCGSIAANIDDDEADA